MESLIMSNKRTNRREEANSAYEKAMACTEKTKQSACEVRVAMDNIKEAGAAAIHNFLTGIAGTHDDGDRSRRK